MQLRQLREFLERRRWQEVLVVEEVVSGSRRRPERDRLLDATRRREIDIIPSGTLPISRPAGSLRVIFHTVAAQAPTRHAVASFCPQAAFRSPWFRSRTCPFLPYAKMFGRSSYVNSDWPGPGWKCERNHDQGFTDPNPDPCLCIVQGLGNKGRQLSSGPEAHRMGKLLFGQVCSNTTRAWQFPKPNGFLLDTSLP